jgi:hypothetical protein
MSEFNVIIFNPRKGEACAHGESEQAAWAALVQRTHPHRNAATEIRFFDLEIRLSKIDHIAVFCGEHGYRIWAERLPLQDVLTLVAKEGRPPNHAAGSKNA